MAKKIKVTQESSTGRNQKFKVPDGRELTRQQLVKEIQQGKHPDYHVATIHGKPTPRSNPDGKTNNNLD